MSNDLTIFPTEFAIPDHMLARVTETTALATVLAAGISGSEAPPRISLKGSRFRLVIEGVETVLDPPKLNLVIVGANSRLSKVFYLADYDPNSEEGPDCFSNDGLRPDKASENIQNSICATCPQNSWGSKATDSGVKLKACSDQKRLAVVSPHDPTSVYLLLITPTSLKNLNKYTKELLNRNISPELVMTTFSFDTTSSHPKLIFSFGGFNSPELQEAVDGIVGSPEVVGLVAEAGEVEPVSNTELLAAPEATPVVETTPAAPVQVVEPEPEPEPEPATPTGFGAAPASPVIEVTPKTRVSKPKAAKPTPVPRAAPVEVIPAAPTQAAGFGASPGASTTPTGFGAAPASPVQATPAPAGDAVVSTTDALAAKIEAFDLEPTDD